MKKLISAIVVLAVILSMSATVFAADTVTVYCQAPEDWETCNVHWWGSAQGESTWPGDAMTKGDDGIWYAEIPADVGGLLFNKAGDEGKTSDLTLPTDGKMMYVIGNAAWAEYGSKVEVVEKYYVAGEEALCGSNWDPADANNLMTEGADGIWTKSYENVAAGTYKLKVTDGTWNNTWGDPESGDPDGNYVLTLESASDITVTFDSVNGAMSVSVEAGDAPVDPQPSEPEASEPEASEPEASEPEASEPEVDETPDTVVVTAKVPADWTNPCIWAWGANGNVSENWPGDAMTKDGDVFTAVVPSWVENVIINNGAAEGALQTVDLAVVPGKDVNVVVGAVIDNSADDDTTNDGNNGKYAAEVTNADGSAPVVPDAPAVDVSGEYRVVGDADWLGAWDPANSVGLMTETEPGVYEITFKDVIVGEYQFKITKNGTWTDNWGKDGYNTDNIALNVTVAGDVTIVFDANRAAISYKTAASDEFIPVTGDMGLTAVCAALLVASAGLVCVVSKKKEF